MLACESPLVECTRTGTAIACPSAAAALERCAWGVWHVHEVLPLFAYLKATTTTLAPLRLTSLDVQTSASPAAMERPAFIKTIVRPVGSAHATRVFHLDSTIVAMATDAKAGLAASWAEAARLRAGYDTLAQWLARHRPALKARVGRADVLLAQQPRGRLRAGTTGGGRRSVPRTAPRPTRPTRGTAAWR